MINNNINAPPPTAAESPDSHEWFRARLDEFIRKCDATVAHILREEAAANLDEEFALPSTDELIGLPPSSRGTNAYAQATKSLKDRLVREVHIMEGAIEHGFGGLAATEKALVKARREVRDLRSVLAQFAPSNNSNSNNDQQQGQQQPQQQSTSASGEFAPANNNNMASPTLSGTFGSVFSASAFPADIAVSLIEEQNELKQLRMTLQSLHSQLSATKKDLAREKAAFKDTCDTAVRCNTVGGPQTLRHH